MLDERDFIIDAKKRYDCFTATDLDLSLRAHGVDTVLITGVNTNSCVIATATAACCRDFAVVVVSDCVDTMDGPELHDAALKIIGRAFGQVMTGDEALAAVGAGAAAGRAPRVTAIAITMTSGVDSMSDPMIPNQRADFSAIVDRPPLKLPGGARIVVWTIVNYEVWDISRPMARQVLPAPTGQPLLPDVPNWSWHEYGMRVGCWRFFDLYKRLNIRPTLSINARVCEDYPRVAGEARDLGWEFMGHAYEQGPIHKVEDQRGMIFKSMDVIEKFTGKRPVGWLGPGLTQTLDTPENSRRGRREVYRRLGL